MDFYDYEDYYEPSEFDEKIEEFKNCLRKSVKAETQELIKNLEKENKELCYIRDNWDKVKQEYEDKVAELERETKHAENNAKRARFEELFEATGMSVILYKPVCEYVRKPKCDKCDDKRKIHFLSPSGKNMTKYCECATIYRKYNPKAYYLCEFRINRDNNGYPLSMWFKKCGDDGYIYDGGFYYRYIYNEESFEYVKENHPYDAYFRDEEKCQEYCDWLNKA